MRADGGDHQIAEDAGVVDVEPPGDPAADDRADDADHDVGEEPHLGGGDLLGDPAGEPAEDDGEQPVDAVHAECDARPHGTPPVVQLGL